VLVTHDMNAVQRFCDRALLLEHGRLVTLDEPRAVARHYNQLNFQRGDDIPMGAGAHAGDGTAAIVDCWFEDAEGRRGVLEYDTPSQVRLLVEFRDAADDPTFGVAITDEQHRVVTTCLSGSGGGRSGHFAAGERVDVTFRFQNMLAAGRYFASPEVVHFGPGQRLMDHRDDAATAMVTSARRLPGSVDLQRDVEISRLGARAASA